MTKSELIKKVADQAGLSQKDTEKVLNAALADVIAAVKAGDPVVLAGFGKFEKKHTAAREGRNPATGAAIKIAAKNAVKFTAQKAFKDALN